MSRIELKSTQLNVRCTPSVARELRALAQLRGQPLGDVLREVVRTELVRVRVHADESQPQQEAAP